MRRPTRAARSRPPRAPRRRGGTGRRGAPQAGTELFPGASVLDGQLERAVGESRAVPSVAAFQARQHTAAATASSLSDRVDLDEDGAGPVERGLGPVFGDGGPSPSPPPRSGTARDCASRPWRALPSTNSGAPRVASSRRLTGAAARPSSIPPATTAPRSSSADHNSDQPAAPTRAASYIIAIVLPAPELRLERCTPVADRGAYRFGEERELVGDVKPHASSARTDSESPPRAGAAGRSVRLAAHSHERREQVDLAEARLRRRGRRGASATTCGSDAIASRCCTGPHGTPADSSTVEPLGDATARRTRRAIGSRELLLRGERAGVVRDEVGRVDRRVLEAEERRGTLVAARG